MGVKCADVCAGEIYSRTIYVGIHGNTKGVGGGTKSASASICTLIRGDDKGFWYFLKSQGLLSARSIFRMIIRSFARIIQANTHCQATRKGKAFRRILRYL